MSARILVLTALVALTGSVAYWLGTEREQKSAEVQSQALMKGFSDSASAVNSITISNAQGVVFKATQQNGEWMANHLDTIQIFPHKVNIYYQQIFFVKIVTTMVKTFSSYKVNLYYQLFFH